MSTWHSHMIPVIIRTLVLKVGKFFYRDNAKTRAHGPRVLPQLQLSLVTLATRWAHQHPVYCVTNSCAASCKITTTNPFHREGNAHDFIVLLGVIWINSNYPWVVHALDLSQRMKRLCLNLVRGWIIITLFQPATAE